jgi:virulence-associated protein VapD
MSNYADITQKLRNHAMYVRDGWSDITKAGEWHERDMSLCLLLESAASVIEHLRQEVRDIRARNVRLMSQVQEMEAREQ